MQRTSRPVERAMQAEGVSARQRPDANSLPQRDNASTCWRFSRDLESTMSVRFIGKDVGWTAVA
jgi:hypothetical protein